MLVFLATLTRYKSRSIDFAAYLGYDHVSGLRVTKQLNTYSSSVLRVLGWQILPGKAYNGFVKPDQMTKPVSHLMTLSALAQGGRCQTPIRTSCGLAQSLAPMNICPFNTLKRRFL